MATHEHRHRVKGWGKADGKCVSFSLPSYSQDLIKGLVQIFSRRACDCRADRLVACLPIHVLNSELVHKERIIERKRLDVHLVKHE